MKKIILLSLVLTFFLSCEKTEQEITSDILSGTNTFVIDEAIDLLSIGVAKAMQYPEFRQLIRTETSKQFDYDYEVLYRHIADQTLNIEGTGETTVKDLVLSQLNSELKKSNLVDRQYFKDLPQKIPTLSFLVSLHFEDWDPINYHPEVVPVLSTYDESDKEVIICKTNGKKELRNIEESVWSNPLIVVGLSERVDEDGYLRVNAGDVCVPKEIRSITADEAYDFASSDLKAGIENKLESIIEVVPDGFSAYTGTDYSAVISETENTETISESGMMKASQDIATPQFDVVCPHPNQTGIYLSWTDVITEGHYEVYKGCDGCSSMIYFGSYAENVTECFVEQQMVGDEQRFYVKAFGSGGSSSLESTKVYHTVGYRHKHSSEYLDKFYMSASAFADVREFLIEGDIELEAQVFRGDATTMTVKAMTGNARLGSASRAEQRDKWKTWNCHLFDWDLSKSTMNYYVVFYEWDNGATWTGTLGGAGSVLEFVKAAIAAFGGKKSATEVAGGDLGGSFTASVQYKSTNNSDEIGFLEVHNYSPTHSDYYYNDCIDVVGDKSVRAVIKYNQ